MGSSGNTRSPQSSIDPPAVVVRAAVGTELDQAGEVCVAAYRADGLTSREYARLLRDARDRARSAEVLIAVNESLGVLGTVTYVASDGPCAQIRGDYEAELRMLAVAPIRRRSGLGACLVRACIEKATADGLLAVAISTAAQMHAAHLLYQQLGFRRNAARDWAPRPGLLLQVYVLDLSAVRGSVL
jgi:GNAT superfamily N-acetyltransferase